MKTNIPLDDVVEYGSARTRAAKAYTFKNSAKQIEILVNRIYEDKVGAVIREICSNAYDAHVLVGKADVPFRVSLPSILDQRFIVRDYGPGLSEQEIEEVYTQFFNSTKEESNEFLGALGLGAKAPFSLVDSYTVTSYQNGTMMCYTMFKKDGELSHRPEMDRPVPTDEPDGLEVSVPVDPKFESEFRQKAARILYWFDVKPVLPDCEELWGQFNSSKEMTIDLGDGSAFVYKNHQKLFTGYGGISIRMGQVLYTINRHEFRISTLGNYRHMVIDVPIGAVDVQPGRETLSYDETTTAYLKDRIRQADRTLVSELLHPVENADNIIDAARAYSKLHNFNIDRAEIKYKGFQLGGNRLWPTYDFEARIEPIATLFEEAKSEGQGYGYDIDADDSVTSTAPALQSLTAYVLIDDEVSVSRKITSLRKLLRRDFAQSEAQVSLVLIDGRPNRGPFSGSYNGPDQPKTLTADEVKRIKEVLPKGDRIYQLSEVKTSDQPKTVFTFNPTKGKGYVNRRDWRPTEISTKGGLYWPVVNGTMKYCAGKNSSVNNYRYGGTDLDVALKNIFDYAKQRFPQSEFILVPEEQMSNLGDNWICVPDFMMSEFKERIKDREWLRGFVRSCDPARVHHRQYYITHIKPIFTKLCDDHPLRKMFIDYDFDMAHMDEYLIFYQVLWLADYKKFSPKGRSTRSQHWQEYLNTNSFINRVIKAFPLVFSNHGSSREYLDDVILYANTKFEILKVGDNSWKTTNLRSKVQIAKTKAKKTSTVVPKGRKRR